MLIHLQDLFDPKKIRVSPESPDDLPGTARQVTRQIRRRNLLGDLSSTTSKTTTCLRKTIADKVVEALTSPAVLDHIIPVISDKLCESIAHSHSKTVEVQVKPHLDEHIRPLRETIRKQHETLTEQKSIIQKQAELVIATNKGFLQANKHLMNITQRLVISISELTFWKLESKTRNNILVEQVCGSITSRPL